jgi:Leucine-rich repeat (LRR) protein
LCGKKVFYQPKIRERPIQPDPVMLDYTGIACPLDNACWHSLAQVSARVTVFSSVDVSYKYYPLSGDRIGSYLLVDSSERCATNAQVPKDAKTLLMYRDLVPPLSDSDIAKRATLLPANFFLGLTQLQKVYLNESGYASFPDDLFQPVASTLEVISMENLGTSAIPSGIFRNLNQLKFVSFSGSYLPSFPLLQHLPKLQTFRAPWGLTDEKFPAFSFYNLPLLSEITTTLKLASIDSQAFKNLPSLTRLEITFSRVNEIPVSAFSELSALQILSLRGSSLTSFPNGLLDSLSFLKDLDLTSNSPASVGPILFRKLTNLEQLYTL